MKGQRTVVELGLAIQVEIESLTFEPSQQAPLPRRQMFGAAAHDRVGKLFVALDRALGFRSVERQRGVVLYVPGGTLRRREPHLLLSRVHRGLRRQACRGHVVAPATEVVVGVPGHVGCEDGEGGGGHARRHDQRERGEQPRDRGEAEVVEARPLGGDGGPPRLKRRRLCVAVPGTAKRGDVAVGKDLQVGARWVVVESPKIRDQLWFRPVSPQLQ